jgi:hypothetical protein
MTNKPKERTLGVSRKGAQDKRAEDIPTSDTGSATPESVAPILRSEDDQPHDEDTPE